MLSEGIALPAGSNLKTLCSGDLVLVASADTEKLDFTSPSLSTLHVDSRASRVVATKPWMMLISMLKALLSERPSILSSSSDSSSEGDSEGDSEAESHAAPSVPWHKRLTGATLPLLEAATSLCQDLPSCHISMAKRSHIAMTATALQKLQTQAEAASFECIPDELMAQCNDMLDLLNELPSLPAILQRASEGGIRHMCISDATLVIPHPALATAQITCIQCMSQGS